jgi:hypothetical protein
MPQLLVAVAGSDTETQLPINVAALLILAIEARRIAANSNYRLWRGDRRFDPYRPASIDGLLRIV